MKAITLLYHDVVQPWNFTTSGFPGPDASIYKLDLLEFQRHLNAIRCVIARCSTASELSDHRRCPTLLTFDDGGLSAHTYVADLLEALGWRGHFFVTTDWIGKRGFLNASHIRDLQRRGHLIGSHSCSHPARMSHCIPEDLYREWKDSVSALSQILGEPVTIASVPGGYYARNVAQAAAEAGIRTLFTSEPEISVWLVNGCRVLGRYTIQRGITAATAAAIAAGKILPRYRQFIYWNLKKTAKIAGGTKWLRMRKWLLARQTFAADREHVRGGGLEL
jgi:peptidoglycan/xylan/chitin deacetylase (PgdA/CDA1 family)